MYRLAGNINLKNKHEIQIFVPGLSELITSGKLPIKIFMVEAWNKKTWVTTQFHDSRCGWHPLGLCNIATLMSEQKMEGLTKVFFYGITISGFIW